MSILRALWFACGMSCGAIAHDAGLSVPTVSVAGLVALLLAGLHDRAARVREAQREQQARSDSCFRDHLTRPRCPLHGGVQMGGNPTCNCMPPRGQA